jgi:glutathione S-transferase
MKVACFLRYKKLPFKYIPVNPVSPIAIKFTKQRQVPILRIGEEWRKDSTPLGIWLNDRFPEMNILGNSELSQQKILAIDSWISHSLITARFRHAIEWENPWNAMRNGWTLARAVNNATPIPMVLRWLWPVLIRKAKFIVNMMDQIELKEPMPVMRQRLCDEFVTHLGNGPFLGEEMQVSLADLSAYPVVVSGHLMGMYENAPMLSNPKIIDWCRRVQEYLPDNPLLVPDSLIVRPHI